MSDHELRKIEGTPSQSVNAPLRVLLVPPTGPTVETNKWACALCHEVWELHNSAVHCCDEDDPYEAEDEDEEEDEDEYEDEDEDEDEDEEEDDGKFF
jgi:hypothetical protein